MAKPDWGELQQRFLSEHAATGVSPKEWCEAQGLNYATARRYIKKPSAQSVQKSAQKKVRTAQKEQSAEELVDDDGLTAQQRRFVAEYLKDGNATQAAIRAGYSKKSAEQIGYQLLQKTSVAQAIAQQQKASIRYRAELGIPGEYRRHAEDGNSVQPDRYRGRCDAAGRCALPAAQISADGP